MQQLVFSGHTGHHPVLVTDEDGLRSLRFGTDERQTCIDLQKPWKLQLAYTQWMAIALLLHPVPKKSCSLAWVAVLCLISSFTTTPRPGSMRWKRNDW